MAVCCYKNTIFLSIFLTIFLPFILTNANPDLIHTICSKTPNPRFCSVELRSDPRSGGANYSVLAGILINKVESRVISMKNVTDLLLVQGNLPVNQQLRIATCLDGCNGAIVDVSWCRYALRSGSGDFKGLKSQAVSILNHFRKCDDLFREAPEEPLKIKDASAKIQELCDAILVISKFGMLQHPFDVCAGFNCGRM